MYGFISERDVGQEFAVVCRVEQLPIQKEV